MHCSLLGPLEVRLGDGPIDGPVDGLVEIGGARLRALLARLALEPGRIVPVEALLDALWGEHPPAAGANALQSLVSRLRRALGDPALVSGAAAGYRLAVQSTDVAEFERRANAGRQALAAGNPHRASRAFGDALALWRGPALADLTDAPFAPTAARRLEEERLAVLEDQIGADLDLGRHAEVIGELERLVEEHPLRERLRGQHITALYRLGRQAEALASYESARQRLADELGVDPSPELQAVHVKVLRGELTAPDSSRPQTNLRAQFTSFVGRDEEVAAITELLERSRLVTLVGPGGAGKTRLASEVGAGLLDRTPDGVWMVELAPVNDPNDVVQAVLSALQLRERGLLDTGPDTRDAVTRLIAVLADKRLVLVIDNCEHLIGPAAALVDTLLGSCPNLRILATTREPLAITGEALRPVPPLLDAPAVQLFGERAVAARPDFDLDRWRDEASEICQRLDGMPLAIELAAARLRSLTPRELADRLDDRFRLLTGGSRTALPRHQTLRAVVDWSWDLLEKPERLLARRLSVFPGGVTLTTAEAVCADDELPAADVVDLLSALVDKSLLQAVGDGRYRMLETIRAYGQERLVTAGEHLSIRRAHAGYFLRLAEMAESHLRGREQMTWLRGLDAEHGNLLAALRFYADTENADGAVRMAAALGWFWSLRGYRAEASAWLNDAVAIPGEASPLARALVHADRAMIAGGSGDAVGAKWALGRALRIRRAHPEIVDQHPFAALITAIATLIMRERAPLVKDEIEKLRSHRDPWVRAVALMIQGHWAENEGRAGDAERDFQVALTEFHEIGDRWGRAATLESVCGIQALRGDLQAARSVQYEALGLLDELEAYEDLAQGLTGLASYEARLGNIPAARRAVERARDLARRFAEPETALFVESAACEVARRSGDLEEARRLADKLLADAENQTLFPFALHSLLLAAAATVDADVSRVDIARERLHKAVTVAGRFADRGILANVVDILAITEQTAGETERAATLLGVAVMIRGLPDLGHPDVVAVGEQVRAVLGPDVFQAAYDAGAAMEFEAALEFIQR